MADSYKHFFLFPLKSLKLSAYCFCGNYFGRGGVKTGNWIVCKGNPNQLCGGSGGRVDIYKTYIQQNETTITSKTHLILHLLM